MNSLYLIFWGLISWMLHPLVWVVMGPMKWTAFLQMTAAQESSYGTNTVGDGGRSIGILQFFDDTWEDLDLGDLDRRNTIRWSAWGAGTYVQSALLTDAGWIWRLFIPYFSAGYGRVLWTNGVTGGLAFTFDGMMQKWDSEGNSRAAWNTWRIITIVLLVPFARLLGVGFRK